MNKLCVLCGDIFDAKGRSKTCSKICSVNHKKLTTIAWKKRNQEKVKCYKKTNYLRNREKYKARVRDYYRHNYEKLYRRKKLWLEKNRDRLRAYVRNKYLLNPEKYRFARRIYKARATPLSRSSVNFFQLTKLTTAIQNLK